MEIIDVNTFVDAEHLPIIDVRSPGEFGTGHIPGAENVPLFDDAERAEVGTLYKQAGRRVAVDRGLEIAEAKAESLVESARAIASDSAFRVHCWRGGMRSEGFAWLCQDCGLKPRVLSGGYKSFRREAHRCFAEPRQVIILAGHTGAGKTRLLGELRGRGQQVIDLEGLANHRGSAFGGIGQFPQPTVEQFENHLFFQWRNLDRTKPVWIEGESRAIGRIQIPQSVWDQMSAAPMIFIEVDRHQRVEFLVQEYGEFPVDELSVAIQRISKRLGGDRLQTALAALQAGDVRCFASCALDHYDKAYSKALQNRSSELIQLPLSDLTPADAASKLIDLASGLESESRNFESSTEANSHLASPPEADQHLGQQMRFLFHT